MALIPYYNSDNVTLYLGDCREILPQLESETFDLVVTDPPYLVSYSGRWGSDWEPIQGDADSGWVLPAYREIHRLLKPDSLCVSFYGWPHADVFLTAWRQVGFRPVSVFALVKRRWGLGYFTRGQHELAYLLAKGKPKKPKSPMSDVLDWRQPPVPLHPNQKPIGALSRLITSFSTSHSIVLDPFCASRSTLVAARQSGRIGIGIEIEERFCEVAAMRLSQRWLDFDEPSCEHTKGEQTT